MCDPPKSALRLLEKAEQIRHRLGIPSPVGAAEMLTDLRRLVHPPVGARPGGQPTARPEPGAAGKGTAQ